MAVNEKSFENSTRRLLYRKLSVGGITPFFICSELLANSLIMFLKIINVPIKNYTKYVQAWTGPERSRTPRLPYFRQSAHKFVRLSAICADRLYPPGNIPGADFC